jgi:prepilin-type processing-associated H-X9-DG protein
MNVVSVRKQQRIRYLRRSPRESWRFAFTMVEVLVVITTIGILVAMLLPAVNSAREAARRLTCSRNLAQTILAVHQYESTFSCYPPGTLEDKGPILNQPTGYHHGWITQILPYIEQKTAYGHIDRNVGVYHANNLPVRRVVIPILRCPSTPAAGQGYSDYAGVHNDLEVPIDADNNGIFFLNSHIRYRDVLDGTSNTLFIGEKHTIPGDLGWMSGTRSTLRNMGTPPTSIAFLFAMSRPPGVAEVVSPPALEGRELMNALFGIWSTPGFARADKANRFVLPKDPLVAVGGFGRSHPGGTNFAAGDGSVRFISGGYNFPILHALANRADRGLIDTDR